ncbi:MAG: nucleotide exchange factor GrpE [Oscillospiraceae bacterium]|nr:nucleotide exchange factor GrpE [Oscillospiraceae bacterium]
METENKNTNPAEEKTEAKTEPAEETAKETKEETAEPKKAEAAEQKTESGPKKKESDELEKLRKQVADLNDRYVRLFAEYDNFRKRTANEKTSLYNKALTDAYSDLFPVLDNFERAYASEDTSPEDFKKGMDMIYKQVQEIFQKAGVEPFGEPGETFDPMLHNAVMHVEDPDKGEGEIVAVFQKGYKLGDKVVRHAMVQVAN